MRVAFAVRVLCYRPDAPPPKSWDQAHRRRQSRGLGKRQPMSEFGTLNWSIVLAYIVGNLVLGYFLSKRVQTADHYYLGRRTTPWWAIGISVVATYFGALTFLGGPAWSYTEGFSVIFIHINYPIAIFVVVTVFLPFFFKSGVASIFDYLERRFGLTSRHGDVRRVPARQHRLLRDHALHDRAGARVHHGHPRHRRDPHRRRRRGHLHHARRHRGGDLDRRDPVRHPFRRGRDHCGAADRRAARVPAVDAGCAQGPGQDEPVRVLAGPLQGGHHLDRRDRHVDLPRRGLRREPDDGAAHAGG